MRIKAIYRKNLKMSEGKIAAQVAHAVKNLPWTPADVNIIVLGVSDKKFTEEVLRITGATQAELIPARYIQIDKGLTEVKSGTQTAMAWIENDIDGNYINY